jgi:hypothetical protein
VIKPAKITFVFVVVLSLAGMTFAQFGSGGQFSGRRRTGGARSGSGSDPALDPGVQTTPRGTGETIIDPVLMTRPATQPFSKTV